MNASTAVNQLTLSDALEGIRRGFARTPTEILVFFIVLSSILLLLVVYAVVQGTMARLRTSRRSREIFLHFLSKLELSTEERETLRKLISYLDPSHQEHDLLIKRRVFDACANKMRAADGTSEALLASLRLKIGFNVMQPYEIPTSSLDLPMGMAFLLASEQGARVRGILAAQSPKAMLLELDAGNRPPAIGHPLTVYLHNSTGMFRFSTHVVDATDRTVSLEHSFKIERFQRRKYYRIRESLHVFVKAPSSAGTPIETVLIDISGGGASLQNPGLRVERGDSLDISFSPILKGFTVSARILRISKDGGILFVKFESLSEMNRERLVSFILAESA